MTKYATAMKNDALDIHDLAAIYRNAVCDYRPDSFSDDDDLLRLKKTVATVLPPEDRVLFIIYTEVRSLSRMAAAFNVSKATMRNEIYRIRQLIINAL